jgi:hypothetical protein
VRHLAALIPKATIDTRVGTKAIDILIPFNAARHERLASFLSITPAEGDLIAIEVEVSSPEKTARSNVEKNAAAGVAHTIIATTTPLRHKPKGAILIDVFELLEAF